MTERETFSVKVIEWDEPCFLGYKMPRTAFAGRALPPGFAVKDDGLYFQGTYQPGQSRCVLPAVNKALAAFLGVER